jgi:hypothetical protein
MFETRCPVCGQYDTPSVGETERGMCNTCYRTITDPANDEEIAAVESCCTWQEVWRLRPDLYAHNDTDWMDQSPLAAYLRLVASSKPTERGPAVAGQKTETR